ncbi:hypothetical protein CsSME_00046967 [Camellia sinensis var. sinensis]
MSLAPRKSFMSLAPWKAFVKRFYALSGISVSN